MSPASPVPAPTGSPPRQSPTSPAPGRRRRRAWAIASGLVLVGLLLGGGALARAAEVAEPDPYATSELVADMAVPAELQVPLLLRVLTYDRNFASKGQTEVWIGIAFVPGDPASLRAKNAVESVLNQLSDKTVRRLPIRHSTIDLTAPGQLASAVRSNQLTLIYLAPGIDRYLDAVLRVGQEQRILTGTGVPEYVQRGAAVGIATRQDRPHIVINLPSSKSAGSAFDASLLRIAKVLR